MKPRMLIVVVLALVCGLSAMVLVNSLRRPAGPAIERAEVVYAIADVKAGETLAEPMLELRKVAVEEIEEDAIRKIADAVDRAALGPIDKGDRLRQKKLAEKGAGRGMAALITSGMRAFTIQTPTVSSSMAGFLLPQNKVDVLLTTTANGGPDDETGGSVTTTLLENVMILASHTTVNAPTANKIKPEDAQSITLMVSPEDAQKLDLGQNRGTLHLSLRNLKDEGKATSKPTMLSDLQLRPKKPPVALAAVPPPPAPAPAPLPTPIPRQPPGPRVVQPLFQVRTLRGTVIGTDKVYPDSNLAAFDMTPSPPAPLPAGPATIAGASDLVVKDFQR